DRPAGAVCLERPYGRRGERNARLPRLRRPRAGHSHPPGLLNMSSTRRPRALRLAALLLLAGASLPAQRRAITVDDFLALKSVGDPQLSPDGKWVAYTVTTISLPDNRGVTRVWLADLATATARQVTQGPGSDRSPRWSPDGLTLA